MTATLLLWDEEEGEISSVKWCLSILLCQVYSVCYEWHGKCRLVTIRSRRAVREQSLRASCNKLLAQWLRICLPVQEMQVPSLGQEDPLEKEMTTHSSILAWEIPWTEEPGRLQSMGSQRFRHNLVLKRQHTNSIFEKYILEKQDHPKPKKSPPHICFLELGLFIPWLMFSY